MELASIKWILIESGFKEISNEKFNKVLAEQYSVDAYINGKGVIFHLLNGNRECKMTIQADNCEDLGSSFSQLMEYLRSHITLLNNGWSIVM